MYACTLTFTDDEALSLDAVRAKMPGLPSRRAAIEAVVRGRFGLGFTAGVELPGAGDPSSGLAINGPVAVTDPGDGRVRIGGYPVPPLADASTPPLGQRTKNLPQSSESRPSFFKTPKGKPAKPPEEE